MLDSMNNPTDFGENMLKYKRRKFFNNNTSVDSSFYSSIQSNWFTWMQQNADEKRKGHLAWGKSTYFKQFIASSEFAKQLITGQLMYWRTLCFECYKKEPQRGMNEEDSTFVCID